MTAIRAYPSGQDEACSVAHITLYKVRLYSTSTFEGPYCPSQSNSRGPQEFRRSMVCNTASILDFGRLDGDGNSLAITTGTPANCQ